ncbi:MAG: hypothetical protein AAF558_06090 [Verrucomicrobiota bacterium]
MKSFLWLACLLTLFVFTQRLPGQNSSPAKPDVAQIEEPDSSPPSKLSEKPKTSPKPKKSGPTRYNFPAVKQVLMEPGLRAHKSSKIPQQYGDTTGKVFVGHRAAIEKYAGWGWIRPEKASWRKGRWVFLEENTNGGKAPGRFLKHPNLDNDYQYRLYGSFAPYKGYEPNFDAWVPVFKIKGFEKLGPAQRPNLHPPRPKGRPKSKPTSGGARSNPFNR